MKKWVVHNKTVPISILALLITDDDVEVRYFIAQKNKISREMFETLADDNGESVHQQLANDDSEFIKLKAIEKLA